LLPRPVTADRNRAECDETLLLREYDALRRLGDTSRAPRVDPYVAWDQDQFWVVPVHPTDGRSLRADRTAAAPVPDRVLPVIKDAFDALAAIHTAGVVHRGLNPDRIHLGPGDRVAFSDFEVARLEGERSIAEQVDALREADPFRAPECELGAEIASRASDIYGL